MATAPNPGADVAGDRPEAGIVGWEPLIAQSRTAMRFAKIVFSVAGVWGIAVLSPLFFLVDMTGREYAPPTLYPHFFYGFLSVAMAWQIAFLAIGSNPARFRLLMIPAIVEKLSWVFTLAVLYSQGRISSTDASAAGPDLLLGVLFIAALLMTPSAATGVMSDSALFRSPGIFESLRRLGTYEGLE
jgi:hypothetical protein